MMQSSVCSLFVLAVVGKPTTPSQCSQCILKRREAFQWWRKRIIDGGNDVDCDDRFRQCQHTRYGQWCWPVFW